ncbi:MAG: cell wall hydrolase [Lachnospiraceae bacterium]|nr:cell wall hydrolase [Lachnospiraceae bacterium]
MLKNRGIVLVLAGFLVSLSMLYGINIDAEASTRKEYLDSLSAGITDILDPSAGADDEKAIEELTQLVEAAAAAAAEKSDLVMADVQVALNVRAEATEESDKVGLLYKDCGGRILERKDGWTKIKSGELVGWASDEYLLFDEKAEALANEVGNLIATIETETLRIRTEPNTDSEIYALIAQDEDLEIVEVIDDNWISVDYEGQLGYVSAEYVSVDFHIDEGETIEAIKKREEEEKKRKLTENQGAVAAGEDDLKLLASLIYCEAGSETYNGQLAVGAVVMNRVRSAAYPNSIYSVIYSSGQFTPAMSGKVARVYNNNKIPDGCYQAAQAAINGETNVGGATHFRRAGNHDGLVIDNQVFW